MNRQEAEKEETKWNERKDVNSTCNESRALGSTWIRISHV